MISLSGCSWISRKTYEHSGEQCKSRAYINNRLTDFVTQRFGSRSQARLGIIPFTVPANFAGQGPGRPDWGYDMSVMLNQELLASAQVPVVEVLDRRDWPGKNEEFSAGNFGAIQSARDAGYDLVLVGMLQPIRNSNELSIAAKVIETESNITVWYGSVDVLSYRPEIARSAAYINLTSLQPNRLYSTEMSAVLAKCVAKAIIADEEPSSFWASFLAAL